MSTNFYWQMVGTPMIRLATGEEFPAAISTEGPRFHIGKRSMAGLYCWDCNRTLCPGGNAGIHAGGNGPWPETCPQCGATNIPEGLRAGPAAVELGFAQPREERPKGVRGTSSFTWAQDPSVVHRTCEAHMDEPVIVDEYGRAVTGREFIAMIRCNCGVEFTDYIGQSFS